MPETRKQIAARAVVGVGWTLDGPAFRIAAVHAAAGVSAGAKAVTDRVRELHTEQFGNVHDEVWRTNSRCDECGQAYPCPTVLLLDQIDTEMGGE